MCEVTRLCLRHEVRTRTPDRSDSEERNLLYWFDIFHALSLILAYLSISRQLLGVAASVYYYVL